MCIDCYNDLGSPKEINERVKHAAELVNELYALEDGGVGGYGHVVFDDWNIEDESIDYCINEANKNTLGWSEETRQASIKALNAFRQLSIEERATALAIYEGHFKI